MIELLNFLNQDILVPISISGFFLWAIFIWKEWSSTLKPKFYLRILIALISIIALSMLVLKPMIWTTVKGKPGVLLTENYQKKSLDSLKKEYQNLKVIAYKENQPLGQVLDSVSSLYILGNGLRSFDFWQLNDMPSSHVEAIEPKGIIRLNYPKEVLVGDEFALRGSFNGPSKGHKLLLADSSGKEIDSILLDTIARQDFALATDLKIKGNYVYKILEKDSSGTIIAEEPIPLKILPQKKLRVLMVNSFPTFESKYLKNFLAEIGNEVTVRSRLTRGKFKFEYFNTKRTPFYSFSKKQLEPFDLLIINANTYVNLPRKSKETILEVLQQTGLGIFVLPNEEFFKLSAKTTSFEFLRQQSSKTYLEGWPRLSWEKFPYSFVDDSRLEAVHFSNEMILTAYRRKGQGRIGTTVIQNSYQLLLDSNNEAYTRFWSKTISDLSKRRESSTEWVSGSQFAFENEPFSFKIRTSEVNPLIVGENGNIPLSQNLDIQRLWSGVTYPKDTGWHNINLKNDSTTSLNFYVMDSTKWKSIKAYNTITKNKRQFNSIADVALDKKILSPFHQLWFFVVFILGMAYLWFAPKLFQD